MAVNYSHLSDVAVRLITGSGRSFTFRQLDTSKTDSSKPWRGNSDSGASPAGEDSAVAVLLDTISSRYLGLTRQKLDNVVAEEEFLIVACASLPDDVRTYNEVTDGSDIWNILDWNILAPGSTQLIAALKVCKKGLYT